MQLAKLQGVRRFLIGFALVAGVLGYVSGGGTGAASTTTTYRDAVLTDSPRAYWRLDEASGTAAADQLGANPGTYTNGVLLNQPGALASEVNPSASFDGVNDYVIMPASSSLDMTSAVTVEFWAKRGAISSTYQVLVGKPGNGQSKYENYAVWLNTSNRYQAYFGDGTTYVSVQTSAVTDTNWHYVVATDDGSSARIYLDGVQKASTSTTLRLTANTNPLNFGRASSNQYFFNGWLDEVAIYPTALSATRIQAHYTTGTTNLIPPSVTLAQPADGASLASSSVPQDPAGNRDTSYGIREIVVGTGGNFTYDLGTLQPNSQVYSSSSYGVLKLTLHSTSYDWQFLPVADGRDPAGGSFTDSGSTSCHAPQTPPPPPIPTVRAVSSAVANHPSPSITINKPSVTNQGDLLLAIVGNQTGLYRSLAPPAGWTAVPNTDYSDGNAVRSHAWYKFAGTSEPSSYTFNLTGGSGQAIAGGILDITGASTSNPINSSLGQVDGPATSVFLTAPSITPSVANTLLVYGGFINVPYTFTPPGLMAEQWDVHTTGAYNVAAETATQVLANAGATGTRPATLSGAARGVAISIAIAPPKP